jgi:SAM-dependent methyltransferase
VRADISIHKSRYRRKQPWINPSQDFISNSWLSLKIRDFFLPRMNILKEVGIRPGFCVLDYGCGSGSYIIAASELVGDSGKIYALDIHPLAVERARRIVSRNHLLNVETIQSGCSGLLGSSARCWMRMACGLMYPRRCACRAGGAILCRIGMCDGFGDGIELKEL